MVHNDSSVTDRSPSSANIESVRTDFLRALTSGEIATDDCNTLNFDDWLQRVEPAERAQLAHLLTRIQGSFHAAMTETSDLISTNFDLGFDSRPAQPESINGPESSLSTRDAAYEAVFHCDTLGRLPEEAKVALAARIDRQEFSPGVRLLEQGQPASGLYLVISGRVEIVDNQGGTKKRIDYDGPGSVLGEMSLLTGQVCSADVIAITQTVALVLPVEAFLTLREDFPELEIALSQLVSDRLGQRPHDALCGKNLGGYTLLRCINRGGMGVVYEANCETSGESRALKMLRHRFISDTRALSRFDFEVDLLSKLRHEHIVQMHGSFVAYRTRFLVLDLCDGADLKHVLNNHGPMDEPTVRAVLGQIAAGLLYAHRQGALHLDLKPANVLVDRRGHLSLTDFGLGRLIKSDGCDECVAGTPSYMAPEQFKALEIGPASDWYALGCLGYELLTGKLLFPEKDLAQMYRRKHFRAYELWDAKEISEELRVALHSALEPMVDYRDLDLEQLASWARPVPGLLMTDSQ